MQALRNLPIHRKLRRIVVLATGAAILVALAVILFYESTTFRPRMLNDVQEITALYAMFLHAPLNFNDPLAAQENLATLRLREHVIRACLYSTNHVLFAAYGRNALDNHPCPKSANGDTGYSFTQKTLQIKKPVIFGGEVAGFFALDYALPPIYARLPQYTVMVLVVFLSLSVVSFLSSRIMRAFVSLPLIRLEETARQVAATKNYLLRAQGTSDDEFGRLASTFNKMLETIERSEAELREGEASKAGILAAAMDCIISIDFRGRICEFNPAAEKQFGITREHASGKELAELIIPETFREAHRRGLARYLATGETKLIGRRVEFPAMRADGSLFDAEISITRIDRADKVPRFTGFLRDVTERKMHETERSSLILKLQEAVRIRDEFLSIASHELKTPLTPLRLQIQLMQDLFAGTELSKVPVSERLSKLLVVSGQQVDRLLWLIGNLLDVSRISAGRITLNREKFDLSVLVREVTDRYLSEFLRANSELHLVTGGAIIGCWDRLRIEQVIVNLMTNALKFGAGKPVEISVTESDSSARLTVKDLGIGIARPDQVRIFGRFERAVSVQNFGGLGLGLYITHQIVEAHKGFIELESELGKGSAFTVVLPLALGVEAAA